MNKQILIGMALGIAAVYLYHHFVNPLPGAKTG